MTKDSKKISANPHSVLQKTPTGIQGFDEITVGGLPQGRPTLLVGSAGCGKTLMAMEFLVRGAVEYGEPGVFMAFEEHSEELAVNFASLGFDINALIEQKKLMIDFVHIERSEIAETGEYDLEGLFIRLAYAIDSVNAKRLYSIPSKRCFPGWTTPPSCAPSCVGCSAGSRTEALPSLSPANAAIMP